MTTNWGGPLAVHDQRMAGVFPQAANRCLVAGGDHWPFADHRPVNSPRRICDGGSDDVFELGANHALPEMSQVVFVHAESAGLPLLPPSRNPASTAYPAAGQSTTRLSISR